MADNAQRVKFLKDMGWEVKEHPVQSGKVKMPRETSAVYERYNNLQKSQGYDLSEFAGKKAMRYVYEVSNYPGATQPVFATLLVYEDRVIGGDITDTGTGGKIRGLKRKDRAPALQPAPAETLQPVTEATETSAIH